MKILLNMNIDFSLAKTSDRDQLLQLLSERQDESNQLRGEVGNVVLEKGADFFERVLANEDIFLIVGKKSEKIIATVMLYLLPNIRKGSYTVFVESVLVAKEYRGQGVGTLLMEYAIDLCNKNPEIRKIKLPSLLRSTKAHSFYEKLGFEAKEKFFQLKLR